MVMMFQVCDFLHRFNVEYGDTFSGFEAGDIWDVSAEKKTTQTTDAAY